MKAKSLLSSLSNTLSRGMVPLVFPALICALFFAACAEETVPFNGDTQKEASGGPENRAAGLLAGIGADTAPTLERIAELERAGNYFPGLGLTESAIREKAADYAGAAVAAYKELSWAYGYGSADREQVVEGLQNALTLVEKTPVFDNSASDALSGCIAYANGDWKRAEELLKAAAVTGGEEPDSFIRWMLLVCSIEQEESAQAARQAYSAIRARYALFPEYWYRGARAFSANENIAAFYAEQCVNISPRGPFADGCRKILAEHLGISPGNRDIQKDIHSHIRTKAEIENIIRASVSANNPALLEELYPLIALPENPYTIYAVGALKALAAIPEFKSFFIESAGGSPGRLGERLSYIARG